MRIRSPHEYNPSTELPSDPEDKLALLYECISTLKSFHQPYGIVRFTRNGRPHPTLSPFIEFSPQDEGRERADLVALAIDSVQQVTSQLRSEEFRQSTGIAPVLPHPALLRALKEKEEAVDIYFAAYRHDDDPLYDMHTWQRWLPGGVEVSQIQVAVTSDDSLDKIWTFTGVNNAQYFDDEGPILNLTPVERCEPEYNHALVGLKDLVRAEQAAHYSH